MKHSKFSLITTAVVACLLSTVAVAQNSNYNNNYNDDRYDNNDNRYDSNNDGRYDTNTNSRKLYAQVINVQRVNNRYASYQRQECWNEQANRFDTNYYRDANGRLYRSDSQGNIGTTVIGTFVNNTTNQTTASIGAALIDGVMGNNNNRLNGYDRYTDNSNSVRRCRTVNNDNNRNYSSGYNVTYRYGNETYHSFMTTRPGRTIRVAVNVQPVR